MDLDPTIGAELMILLGLVIAIAGYWLFKGFVSFLGAIVLGGAFFFIGLWIGGFVGGILGLVIAIVLAIIGAALGALLAIVTATVILGVGFGIIAFSVLATTAERLGLSGTLSVVLGIVVALIATAFFLVLARTMIKAATAVLGGFLVGSGTFYLLDRFTSLDEGVIFPVSLVIFIIVASMGFFVQASADGKKKRHPRKKGSSDRVRDRGRRKGKRQH